MKNNNQVIPCNYCYHSLKNNNNFEEITFFIVTDQQNSITPELLMMLKAVENLYNSTLNDEGESNIKFELIARDSTSNNMINTAVGKR